MTLENIRDALITYIYESYPGTLPSFDRLDVSGVALAEWLMENRPNPTGPYTTRGLLIEALSAICDAETWED